MGKPPSGPTSDALATEAETSPLILAKRESIEPASFPASDARHALHTDHALRCFLRLVHELERPMSEADLRGLVPIPDGGMTEATFLLALQRLDMSSRSLRIGRNDLAALPTPYMLFGKTSDGHRIVIDVREDGRLVAFDPTKGAAFIVRAEELRKLADRVILAKPEVLNEKKHHWRTLMGGRVRRVLWQLIVASLMVNLFALAMPLFIMTVYNRVIGQQAMGTLEILIIGMLILYAFDGLLRVVRGYVSSHTGARVDALIGSEVIHRLLNLPYRKLEDTGSGITAERVRQLDTIRNFFTGQMPMTIGDLGFVFLFLGVLFLLHPLIGAVTLAAIPIFIALSFIFFRTQRRLIDRSFQAQASKSSALYETMSNILTVKSNALESEVEKRWGDRLALSAYTGFKSSHLSNIVSVTGAVLQQVMSLFIIYIGVQLIFAGELTIGALIATNILASRALAPIRQVATVSNQIQEVRAAFGRLDDIMSEPVESAPGKGALGGALRGEIGAEEIGFRYSDEGRPTLSNISFTVSPGQILGVIGPSGSGKSTLAKLLLGLYRPEPGRILIDETDIQHISPALLRRQIAYVPQEVELFSGTVSHNIGMGLPNKDPRRIVAAAQFAGAHSFIQKLPDGYDSVLKEGGKGLSAGQRQLLCVARAIVRNSRILIMDEPTSALDGASENHLLQNLRRASRGRTIILISHRPATVAIADNILVIEGGEMVASGPPEKILPSMVAAGRSTGEG